MPIEFWTDDSLQITSHQTTSIPVEATSYPADAAGDRHGNRRGEDARCRRCKPEGANDSRSHG
jgi:hypothetical protein